MCLEGGRWSSHRASAEEGTVHTPCWKPPSSSGNQTEWRRDPAGPGERLRSRQPNHARNASSHLLRLTLGNQTAADYAVNFLTLSADAGWNDTALQRVILSVSLSSHRMRLLQRMTLSSWMPSLIWRSKSTTTWGNGVRRDHHEPSLNLLPATLGKRKKGHTRNRQVCRMITKSFSRCSVVNFRIVSQK